MAEIRPNTDWAAPESKLDTLVHVLHYAADRAPARTAIICDNQSVTYGEYRHGVNVLAAQLIARGAAGQRVVVLMTNSIEMSMAIYAIWSIGAATVLLNPFYTERELAPLIADAEPKLVLCDANAYEKIQPIAKAAGVAQVVVLGGPGTGFADLLRTPDPGAPAQLPRPSMLAALQYTGGTTGLPKGAIRTHEELMHTVRLIDEAWPQRREGEVWLNVAPQFHIWGLCMTSIAPVYGRNTLVLMQRFVPDAVLTAIAKHRVSIFAGGPPAIFNGLMAQPSFRTTDFSSLRMCIGGGASIPIEIFRAWEAVTKTAICEGYGMSEGSPISLNKSDGTHKV
ncbi:MAG: class I adenylate-forming enzyme family protein, partial [Alphaproteobacteria bacterium]